MSFTIRLSFVVTVSVLIKSLSRKIVYLENSRKSSDKFQLFSSVSPVVAENLSVQSPGATCTGHGGTCL